MTTTLVEPKARGLKEALEWLVENEDADITPALILKIYTVDGDELYRTDDLHQCEQCGGHFVERLPRGLCEPCAVAVDEWEHDTRQPGVYGHASGRTL